MRLEARHGDVGLIRIETLPEGAKKQPRKGDLILALGEATGHAHRIKEKSARIFAVGDTRYLVIERPTTLDHEEHGPITLQPGAFLVRIEREYSPEAIRQVLD